MGLTTREVGGQTASLQSRRSLKIDGYAYSGAPPQKGPGTSRIEVPSRMSPWRYLLGCATKARAAGLARLGTEPVLIRNTLTFVDGGHGQAWNVGNYTSTDASAVASNPHLYLFRLSAWGQQTYHSLLIRLHFVLCVLCGLNSLERKKRLGKFAVKTAVFFTLYFISCESSAGVLPTAP